MTKKFLILSLTALFTVSAAGVGSAAYKVGDTVNNFILDDPYDISHSLNDFEGKIFVLNFFANW